MTKELDGALTVDQNSEPLQVLGFDTTASITVGVASATATLPAGTTGGDIVRIACNTDCYVSFTATADTSDDLFITGVEYLKVPNGATDFAAIRVSTDGVLTITRMK